MILFDAALSLQGKEYVEGWQDCYTLVQQLFQSYLDVTLIDLARPHLWYLHPDLNFFVSEFQNQGFVDVGDNPRNVRLGDVLLLSLGRPQHPNHVATYVGQGKILHHLEGQRSFIEEYSPKWRMRVKKVLRHTEMERTLSSVNPVILSQLPYEAKKKLGGFGNA